MGYTNLFCLDSACDYFETNCHHKRQCPKCGGPVDWEITELENRGEDNDAEATEDDATEYFE